MKFLQELLTEAQIRGGDVGPAMTKIVSYLQRKLGEKFIKIPGIEHFHNSSGHGYGMRFVMAGTTRCVRFNWNSEPQVGKTSELQSIDLFTHHRDPAFSVHTKGISLVKALPALVTIVMSPSIGRKMVFPVGAEEAMSVNESVLSEARRDDFTAEEAVSDFLSKLTAGKTFTRSDFIGSYHVVHAGIFDTVFKDFKTKFVIDNKRISIKPGTKVDSLKDSILSKAGVIEVTKGGTKEIYLKTKQEEELEANKQDRIPFADTLEHLEGLVTGVIKGAFNALFVAGKGGSVSGSTPINIIIDNPNNISNDNDKTEDTSSNSI